MGGGAGGEGLGAGWLGGANTKGGTIFPWLGIEALVQCSCINSGFVSDP